MKRVLAHLELARMHLLQRRNSGQSFIRPGRKRMMLLYREFAGWLPTRTAAQGRREPASLEIIIGQPIVFLLLEMKTKFQMFFFVRSPVLMFGLSAFKARQMVGKTHLLQLRYEISGLQSTLTD